MIETTTIDTRPATERPPDTAGTQQANAFEELNRVLTKWFYKPDLQAIRIVLGTMQSHYLRIANAWLFVVAPPGTGKTTMSIMDSANLPQVISLGDFSENTFISGFAASPTPGILEQLGPQQWMGGTTYMTEGDAIFLAKDFTTVLSMRREKRAAILAQLREIYDGAFTRAFGTGKTKTWRGRVTVIAAVTPILDRYYSIFTTLGERFLQVRWHRPDSPIAGERAIDQQGQEDAIQTEIGKAVSDVFKKSEGKQPPVLSDSMRHRLAAVAEIVAIGRTHIFRANMGNREIEYVPEPEANTRIAKGLASIARGIASLTLRTEVAEDDLQDAMRVALDSMPDLRRQVLLAALHGREIKSVAANRTVLERAIEELQALEMLVEGDGLQLSTNVKELFSDAAIRLDG